MLLAQKRWCAGALALTLYCSRLMDERHTGTAADAAEAGLLLEIPTPIAKSWPSAWCLVANSMAIREHGGYGDMRDFPVEPHWRDSRRNMQAFGHTRGGVDLARGGLACLRIALAGA